MVSLVRNNNLKPENTKEIASQIALILQDIRYGSVEVVVHDGRVVQIDKRERFRLCDSKNTS